MLALVVNEEEDKFTTNVQEISMPICDKKDEIIIKVSYSSVNYKDALSSIGNRGITKNFPHVTGIDVAGIVHESTSSIFKIGERVLVTGYDLGMNVDGGHAEYVKVPASWVARIPEIITEKEIMTYGTAGLTAALSISCLEKNNIKISDGPVLVTGATGGVGIIAVSILNKLGYSVTAITGKENKVSYLKKNGANEIILREEFLKDNKRNLLSEKYIAVIDTVGGDLLSCALKQLKYDGIATCCGLVASYKLNTTIFPFILRGIKLFGIDSVECKLEKKQEAWNKLANKWKIDNLDNFVNEITLKDIKQIYNRILDGDSVGRYVVKI